VGSVSAGRLEGHGPSRTEPRRAILNTIERPPGRVLTSSGFACGLERDRKTIIRGGAGLFYDRVPLMAVDFLENPTCVVSLYGSTGWLLYAPITYQNTYLTAKPGQGPVPTKQNPDSSPSNLTTSIEVDREIRPNFVARFKYVYSQTQDLYVVNPITAYAGGPA
jgi:hypothetical protein